MKNDEINLEEEFSEIFETIQEMKKDLTYLTTRMREVEKRVYRKLNTIQKKLSKFETKQEERKKKAPSGFAKAVALSTDLCEFMNKPEGTEMARTDVTKYIVNYIKENNLQDNENKRKIIADQKLTQLLSIPKENELDFFNLQSYMNKHFEKL